MAQSSSLKEEFLGTIVHLEKSKLASTNTPVKYDFVAITSNGTIEKAIAQMEVENNKLIGVIVEINNSTNEVLVLTKGVFKTTYFNTIDSVNISYGTKLYLSDVSAGKLKTTSPITGVGKCISLMTKRGIYVDAVAVQEVFMNQSSYDAIKGNLDSFSFINNKLLYLESLVNNFDLNFLSSQIDEIKNNLKNFVPITGGNLTGGNLTGDLFVTGNGTFGGFLAVTGDVTFDLSDTRLKTEFEPIETALEKIKKLDVGTYYYNDLAREFGFTKTDRQVGLKAQQVQSVLPEAVALAPFDRGIDGLSKSGEEYLTVRYEKLVPLLVAAVKEQASEIEKLKNELEVVKHG